MGNEKTVRAAKFAALLGFLVLLCATYYLRCQVLLMSRIRFSSDNVRADEAVKEMQVSYPERLAEYELQKKQYAIEMEHYKDMLELYRTNYDEYVRRQKDLYSPSGLPRKPDVPRTPEVRDELTRINAAFRAQKYHYFSSAVVWNWVACAAALVLVAGLLYLLMFDVEGRRIFYVVVLLVSFVFMIGPAFQSILSGIIGLMREPGIY